MRGYYGWWIVAISLLMMFLTVGATMQAFGMFVLPVSLEFGLSRADTNTGIILVNLGMAAISPFLGRMLDIYPIRWIMAVCAFLFGASLVILGLSHNLWLSAVVLAVPLALGIAGAGTLTSMTLVARWFEAQRGRAMAIAVMGMSLGTVVMAPLVGWLIENFGWRTCLIMLGLVIGAILLVLVPFVRPSPGPNDIEPRPAGSPIASDAQPQVAAVKAKPFSAMQLLRLPHYWLLVLSAALAMAALQAIMVSLVPLAQESGLSVAQSASLLSIVGAMAMIGKLALVWLGDMLNRSVLLSILFALIALSSAALLFGTTYPTLIVCSALLGLVAGATMPVFLALLADRIGAASFGTANGMAGLVMALMGAAAVRFSGEIYDRTGGYDGMFYAFMAVGLLAGLLTFASGKAKGREPAAAMA